MSAFHCPVRIVLREGASADAADALLAAGTSAGPVLVLVDPGCAALGLHDAACESLAGRGFTPVVHAECPVNPALDDVARASDVLVTSGAVAIVALGGGSTLDLAKGAAAAARVGKSLGAHDRRGTAIPSPLAPIVAVPTTAGSGSEVTPFAVLVDRDHGEKVVLSAPGLYPVTALLDPALLRSLPRTPLVAAGLDAITHALESFLGLRASPLVDALALGALDRLWVSLPLAADVTRESRPLATLLCASTMAGMAVANGSAGIVHAISNLLAARYGTSHGLVNAAVLAPTLRFLSAARLEHFRRIAAVIGAPSAADVPHAIEDLVRRLMPGLSLASLGVPRQHAPELAAALASDYQTRFNTPRVPDESALLTILQEAF